MQPCHINHEYYFVLALFSLWNSTGAIKQNVQAALFHALKADSGLCCKALKSMWFIVTGGKQASKLLLFKSTMYNI